MTLTAEHVLGWLMRWIHISSAVLLVGSFAYARMVALPALADASPLERVPALERLALRFRPLFFAAMTSLAVSGIYNLLSGGHSVTYYIGMGLKVLLAAHIFAAGLLTLKLPAGKPADEAKRSRLMSGIVFSGLAAILIAVFLGSVIY